MRCGPCGLVWDVNDPEPPACRMETSSGRRAGKTSFVRAALGVDLPDGDPRRAGAELAVRVPVELPLDLALRMEMAYEAVASGADMPSGAAMRAAWRVFLDGAL